MRRIRRKIGVQPVYSVPYTMKKKTTYPEKYLIGYKINGVYVNKTDTKLMEAAINNKSRQDNESNKAKEKDWKQLKKYLRNV